MTGDRIQSALLPAGFQAERIAALWWVFLVVLGAIYLLVLAALAFALIRAKPGGGGEVIARRPAIERALFRAVALAAGGTVVILFVLLIQSTVVGARLHEVPDEGALTVQINAHQFWWEVRYHDPDPSLRFVTANEIHIPIGRPVKVELTSADVIHSFWVPNLHGKRDLIPGIRSSTVLRAERPGIYRGQCSEFCGHGHAKMALWVVAEEAHEFEAWVARQRRPALPPDTELEQRGHDLFVGGPCAMCHAIQGTTAAAINGPDLTHVASRISIAAGALANTRGHLAGWLVDSQAIKPGNRMPPLSLAPADLHALLAYLESLE